jgi:membrane dipeptidase
LIKSCYFLILIATLLNSLLAQSDYQSLHRKSLVVDAHTDVILQVLRGADISKRLDYGHVDLVRLKEGGVDIQFFAMWPNPDIYKPHRMYEHTLDLIATFKKIIWDNPDKIRLTQSPQEIRQALQDDRIAGCIGVEGGTAIENDLEKLQALYDLGVRYLGLTWNDSPDWASSAADEVSESYQGHKGLTDFGRAVIRKMNELGMIVDVSHSGEKTFWDVLETSLKPIIASHSCVKACRWHYRNLSDDQIKAIARNGGVIFINFYPGYLDYNFGQQFEALIKSSKAYLDSLKRVHADDPLGYRKLRSAFYREKSESFLPGIERILDHMDHIIALIGDDHLGLGSDFDGISISPKGLEDVSDMPEITRCMLERGYAPERIAKILGGNFMRVFEEIYVTAK